MRTYAQAFYLPLVQILLMIDSFFSVEFEAEGLSDVFWESLISMHYAMFITTLIVISSASDG